LHFTPGEFLIPEQQDPQNAHHYDIITLNFDGTSLRQRRSDNSAGREQRGRATKATTARKMLRVGHKVRKHDIEKQSQSK